MSKTMKTDRPPIHGLRCIAILAVFFSPNVMELTAQTRSFAPVPPSLEIEVVNPGADPNDVPAVNVENGIVDIPPVLMVHRYYYSGDRSFQGPMLPGGPGILVVNHPKTGERVYIPAQMMPGAPRVTYTKSSIVYDYEEHAVTLKFPVWGDPVVAYRSGYTWQQKANRVLHIEQIAEGIKQVHNVTTDVARRGQTTIKGVVADVKDKSKIVTLPIKNVAQSLPFGKMLFSGDLEQYYARRAAEHQQDHRARQAARQFRLDNASLKTNR